MCVTYAVAWTLIYALGCALGLALFYLAYRLYKEVAPRMPQWWQNWSMPLANTMAAGIVLIGVTVYGSIKLFAGC